MDGGVGFEGLETSGSVNVPLMRRVLILVGAAVMSALVALLVVRFGLDALFDHVTNSALGSVVPDGRLRLAGISAPLSEELARLAGFSVAIGGIGWMAHREGVPESAFDLRVPWISVLWVFGMISGVVFAVFETIWNGDPFASVFFRTLAHGSLGTIVLMGLAWGHRRSTAWAVLGGLLLAMLLHGIANAMGALELGKPALVFRVMLAYVVIVGAVIAVRVWPDIFGVWTLHLGLRTRGG